MTLTLPICLFTTFQLGVEFFFSHQCLVLFLSSEFFQVFKGPFEQSLIFCYHAHCAIYLCI